MAALKLGYTILYVENVELTLDFYQRAFGFKVKMMTTEKEYGELDTGNTALAFATNSFVKISNGIEFEEASPTKVPPPVELGFVTENVEAAYSRAIAAGAVSVKEPVQKPWGQYLGYVRDINGFLVEICSPVS